jgi:hypothetical protein
MHANHRLERVPDIAADRMTAVLNDFGGGVAAAVLPVLGLLAGSTAVLAAVGSALLLFAAHLSLAQPPYWTVYYLEALGPLAFAAAVGAGLLASGRASFVRGGDRPGMAGVFFLAMVLGLLPLPKRVVDARKLHESRVQQIGRLEARLASLERPSIVFIRLAAGTHDVYVRNEIDLARARVWTAHDLGRSANRRLRMLAPERSAYLYDPVSGELTPLPPL